MHVLPDTIAYTPYIIIVKKMNDVLESIRLSIKYSYSLHSECVVIEFTLLNLCMRLTICRSDLSYVTLSSMPLL